MPKHEPLTPQAVESPVADYIVNTALLKIEKIVTELEQCLGHTMDTMKAAEIAITGFNVITDRMANDAYLLSSTVTALASSGGDKSEADSSIISSIEFSVLMNEIAELRAQLASLERGES